MRSAFLKFLTISFFLITVVVSAGYAQEPSSSSADRIGTFDSRAVAIAYYRSTEFQDSVGDLRTELEEAKASGDEFRVGELEAYGPAMQHRMHQQAFSIGSVMEIMDQISDALPELAREAGVSVIVSQWEVTYANSAADFVDLTPQLVALFNPSEETLNSVESLKTVAPVPMDQLLVPDVDEGRKLAVAKAIRAVIDERGVEAGIEHYRELKTVAIERHRELREAAPEEYNFAESELNDLGYSYMSEGETETAIEIFKLNVEAYPNSFNTYDSLGEGYMEAGQTELAVENYERSLELNPDNDNARVMLRRMGADVEGEDGP
ncbi:MAG: tetratricopeptide repeat protein [Gemmatimonadales bacterium]|nr:MAG: tetratricopeptide repeat protein [Gemmatimonadales bacterium]